jgi:hypothetical protein
MPRDYRNLPIKCRARRKESISIGSKRRLDGGRARKAQKLSGRTWDGRFGGGLGLMPFGVEVRIGFDGLSVAQTSFVTLIANSIMCTSTCTFSFNAKRSIRPDPEQARINLTAYFDPNLMVQSITARALVFDKPGEAAPLALQDNRFVDSYSSLGRPGNGSKSISQVMLPLPATGTAGTTLSHTAGFCTAWWHQPTKFPQCLISLRHPKQLRLWKRSP